MGETLDLGQTESNLNQVLLFTRPELALKRPEGVEERLFFHSQALLFVLDVYAHLAEVTIGKYHVERAKVAFKVYDLIKGGVLPPEAESLLQQKLPKVQENDPWDPYNPNPYLQPSGWRE